MLAKLGRPGDFSLAPPDVSDDAPSGWYMRADAGYVASTGAHVTTGGIPAGLGLSGSGWSVGGGLGYRFLPVLRGEVSLDYLDLGSAGNGGSELSANAAVALASLYWDVITLAGFTPYLSVGAGFSINALHVAPAAFGPAVNDWEFAWSAGAGVSYALSSDFSLDLSYRYLDLGSPPSTGVFALSDAVAHQVRLGVRYMLR
ncbi:outer membrane protein [Xanthobacter autotrophicus]|uniref:outer membrane protein n=1 Tax=Xanthobacter autotrophicus TaxID=280 RepID=UPI0024A67BD2|nr:outer membrane beta-barrel protein [Xanthobacter autotrophicus]MDI4658775.1 outer membrane beta-barrel protein [Xanthobacter autotrophicus]